MIDSMRIAMVPVYCFEVFCFIFFNDMMKLIKHLMKSSICSLFFQINYFVIYLLYFRTKHYAHKSFLAATAVFEKALIYVTLKQKQKAHEYLQKSL
jgi:hypothetical protein